MRYVLDMYVYIGTHVTRGRGSSLPPLPQRDRAEESHLFAHLQNGGLQHQGGQLRRGAGQEICHLALGIR